MHRFATVHARAPTTNDVTTQPISISASFSKALKNSESGIWKGTGVVSGIDWRSELLDFSEHRDAASTSTTVAGDRGETDLFRLGGSPGARRQLRPGKTTAFALAVVARWTASRTGHPRRHRAGGVAPEAQNLAKSCTHKASRVKSGSKGSNSTPPKLKRPQTHDKLLAYFPMRLVTHDSPYHCHWDTRLLVNSLRESCITKCCFSCFTEKFPFCPQFWSFTRKIDDYILYVR